MAWWTALSAAVVRRWARTWRVTITLSDGRHIGVGDPWIDRRLFAVAERDLLALLPMTAGHEWVTAIAVGPDGDRAAAVAACLNVHVARGAAGRGGLAALESMVRLCMSDRPAVLSVDGPLGPAGVAKPGIVSLGARCGRDVVPVAAAARWSFRFPGTWSGIYVPLPFSRVCLEAGDPLPVSGATDRHGRTAVAAMLTARMAEARAVALMRVHAS